MALTTTKQRRAIGERLAQERRRLNYTELQIAQLLGVQLEVYLQYESGEDDPGIFSMQRLYSIGFDVMFIITGDRYRPVQEESELLNRFRELSLRGKTSVFMTLDALERLAPNLKENIKKKIRDTLPPFNGKKLPSSGGFCFCASSVNSDSAFAPFHPCPAASAQASLHRNPAFSLLVIPRPQPAQLTEKLKGFP